MKKVAIDLFAGIGGRLGFQNVFEDMEVKLTVEMDKYAIEMYNNYFKENNKPTDITKIDEKDVAPHDFLFAGFPCQAFSIAGLRKGFEDTRGTLFFDVARIMKYHKPKVVFLENVKGLLTHDKGKTFEVIKKTLNELGYKIKYKLINSADFGVPQRRERIFIVGFRDEKHFNKFKFPEWKVKRPLLWDVLEKDVEEKYYIRDEPYTNLIKRSKIGYYKSQFVTNTSIVSPTITTRTSNGSVLIYQKPSYELPSDKSSFARRLTPTECRKLQGFPDDYEIIVSDTQAYKVFGNSVTVPVIENIAKSIKIAIDEN